LRFHLARPSLWCRTVGSAASHSRTPQRTRLPTAISWLQLSRAARCSTRKPARWPSSVSKRSTVAAVASLLRLETRSSKAWHQSLPIAGSSAPREGFPT